MLTPWNGSSTKDTEKRRKLLAHSVNDIFPLHMTLWLRIVYGHIFEYSLVRPGTYSQQQLLL